MGEVGAGQGKNTSKLKEGEKDGPLWFNFSGNIGNNFETAFSTQPIQVTL